jgi:hypothetical protein
MKKSIWVIFFLSITTAQANEVAPISTEPVLGVGISWDGKTINSKSPEFYFPFNIYWKIAKQLGTVGPVPANHVNRILLEQKLRELTNNNKAACKLTLGADGRIVDLAITESSGSATIDDKIVQLVKSCEPYENNDYGKNITYKMTFPDLDVGPIIPKSRKKLPETLSE